MIEYTVASSGTAVRSAIGNRQSPIRTDQIRQLRDCCARQKRLENLLIQAYRCLPEANHLDTIPGIGDVTA